MDVILVFSNLKNAVTENFNFFCTKLNFCEQKMVYCQ